MRRRLPVRDPVLGFVCVTLAWGAAYAIRLRDGFSNVDDYYYAAQSAALGHAIAAGPRALVAAWRAFARSSPLVPMLGSPVAAFSKDPSAFVIVQLPLLVALWLGLRELGRCLGLADRAAWIAATVVAVSPPVVSYAAMWHFAIAASAALVWSVVAYLRSDRLRDRRWAVTFGACAGVLSLTRVVAVVYVAALVAVCAVDLRGRVSRGAGVAVAAFAVVAGPWWAVAGRQAFRYLRYAGYDPTSGFAPPHGSPLAVPWARLRHTAAETGLVLSVLLATLLVVAVVRAVRARDRAVLLPAAVAVLALLVLGTSTNRGTAFALPVLVVMAVVAATAIRRPVTGAATVLVTAMAILAELAVVPPATTLAAQPLWVGPYPGRVQAYAALGERRDPTFATYANDEVAHHLAGHRVVLLVRSDAIVNGPSLRARLPEDDSVTLTDAAYGETRLTGAELAGVDAVVAGASNAPYHPNLDPATVDAQLRDAGFAMYYRLVLFHGWEVALWRR